MQAIERIEGTKNGYKVDTEYSEKCINEDLKVVRKLYDKINCIIVNPKCKFSFRCGHPFYFLSDNKTVYNKKVPIDSFYINGRF